MKVFSQMSTLDRIRAIQPGAKVTFRVGAPDRGVIESVDGEYVYIRSVKGYVVEAYRNELTKFLGWASGSQPDLFREYTTP